MFLRNVLAVLWVLFALAAPPSAFAAGDECPAGGQHDYAAELVRQATDDADGLRTYICSKCGDSFDMKIPTTGHEWGPWITDVEPTCVSQGSAHRVCRKTPQQVHREYKTLPALSKAGKHMWKKASSKAATCTARGKTVYICTVCGAKKTELLQALGHAWGAWKTVGGSGEGAQGIERRICSRNVKHVQTREANGGGNRDGKVGDMSLGNLEKETDGDDSGQGEVEGDGARSKTLAQAAPSQVHDEHRADSRYEWRENWQPNALDKVLLALDGSVLAVFAVQAVPLLYQAIWIRRRQRQAQEQSCLAAGNRERGTQ